MDKTKYQLKYIHHDVVFKTNEKSKQYYYEKRVVTKNNERFKYSDWMKLVREQAEITFELGILETLIEFFNISGFKNISERNAYQLYASQAYKEKTCPITYLNLDLFHQMMNKKVEQISLF